MEIKNYFIFAAHPDDEVLGCGGAIAKIASNKKNHVTLMTFTNGVSARNEHNKKDILVRERALKKAAKVLGIKSLICGNFPDNAMDSVPLIEICQFIEKNLKKYPDVIFTHNPECLNIDHKTVYQAVITVFRPQYGKEIEINCFDIPSSSDWNPLNSSNYNLFIDVSKTYRKKMQALGFYEKEMKKYPHQRSYQSILNKLKSDGNIVGFKYAEKFQTIRKVIK
jgi:N-acetylglucosamine malate deacetylase 1